MLQGRLGKFPDATKKRKLNTAAAKAIEPSALEKVTKVIVQFKSAEGADSGPQVELPLDVSAEQLQQLINQVLENEEKLPYSFFLNEEEITDVLQNVVTNQKISTESILPIVYRPQAIFRVRAVTRCSSSLPGHDEAVLHVSFSSDGKEMASGSGDATVRIWDTQTETPRVTLKGHKNWVLAVCWSPNNKYIASGSMDGDVRIWDPKTGKEACKPLRGHSKWITGLAWEPMHRNYACTRIASASKDGTVKIWDVVRQQAVMSFSGHTAAVKCIAWGGEGLIYSGSQDRTIKVWDAAKGTLVRTLEGHAHWVNTLSLSTWYTLRMGAHDHTGEAPADEKEAMARCKEKYDKALVHTKRELLVSGSDDFTCFLWDPTVASKPITRMTGHQQPVNFVMYSPDSRYIATASFDCSVKLWNGLTGAFVATFRGHVQSVYQVAWSGDSRMFVSSSKDSTMKIWDVRTKKAKGDLPGHADEVFAVDWSPTGERVGSGGKDKIVKIWQ